MNIQNSGSPIITTALLLACFSGNADTDTAGTAGNSLRIAYYNNGYDLKSDNGAHFLDRVQRNAYNYVCAEFPLFAAPGQPSGEGLLYENVRSGVASACTAVDSRGLHLIPLIQMGSCHSLGWRAVKNHENPGIRLQTFRRKNGVLWWGKWEEGGAIGWAPDPMGIDRSFAEILSAIRDGHRQSGVSWPLEFIHLGHDEPQVWDGCLIGGLPGGTRRRWCYGGTYRRGETDVSVDTALIAEYMQRLDGSEEKAVQALLVDAIYRRMVRVRQVCGPEVRTMIYGDSWDPESWGGVAMKTGFGKRRRIRLSPGILDLPHPDLTDRQRDVLRKHLVLVLWNHEKRSKHRRWWTLCLAGDYTTEKVFRSLAEKDLKFLYCVDTQVRRSSRRQAGEYAATARSFREHCLGYMAAAFARYDRNRAQRYNAIEYLRIVNANVND